MPAIDVIAKDIGEFRLFNRLRLSETGSGSVDGKDKHSSKHNELSGRGRARQQPNN